MPVREFVPSTGEYHYLAVGSWPVELGLADGLALGDASPPNSENRLWKIEFQPWLSCVRKSGAELGSLLLELVAEAVVVVAFLGSGEICLAVTTSRLSDVPGGVHVMSVSSGSGVWLSTPTSVGSTTLLPVTS